MAIEAFVLHPAPMWADMLLLTITAAAPPGCSCSGFIGQHPPGSPGHPHATVADGGSAQ
jgi:hypothetical protein